MIPNILTIAGSDSSSGAGIQADIKTSMALGCYAASVITMLTAQNTQGITASYLLPDEFIAKQITAIADDLTIKAIKLGVLANIDNVRCIANGLVKLDSVPVVLDPVLQASSGDALSSEALTPAMIAYLFPKISLITPNLAEASCLLGRSISSELKQLQQVAIDLHALGASAVLLTGGHAPGEESIDIFYDGEQIMLFSGSRVPTNNTHGTGCTLSTAIACYLAHGCQLPDAISKAKEYVTNCLLHAEQLDAGNGPGPVNHGHRQLNMLL